MPVIKGEDWKSPLVTIEWELIIILRGAGLWQIGKHFSQRRAQNCYRHRWNPWRSSECWILSSFLFWVQNPNAVRKYLRYFGVQHWKLHHTYEDVFFHWQWSLYFHYVLFEVHFAESINYHFVWILNQLLSFCLVAL